MFMSGGVGRGLTEKTICGLMNAAPWPPSAGAFQTSVGAGLPSSSALAKADFLTAALLRSFGWRPRGRARVYGESWISTTSCCSAAYTSTSNATPERSERAPRPARWVQVRLATDAHASTSVHVPVASRAALNAAEILSFAG